MKFKKVENITKDLSRGEGNRVAPGGMLLQEGRSEKDHKPRIPHYSVSDEATGSNERLAISRRCYQ